MNYMVADSECSSGCESGWTLYLDNSSVSPFSAYNSNDFVKHNKRLKQEDEEEEDLSMVSDASSGPSPLFHEHEYYQNCNFQPPIAAAAAFTKNNNGKREKKSREKTGCRTKLHQHPSLLDDTASSPIFNFSNNNLAVVNNQASVPNMVDFSQGYSTNHFEPRSVYQEHYGFFQSSLTGNQLQPNQWHEGRRW